MALETDESAVLTVPGAFKVSSPTAEAAPHRGAVELTAAEVSTATEGFADARVIGTGGFGKVYVAEPMPSLPLERLAVKRADERTRRVLVPRTSAAVRDSLGDDLPSAAFK